MTTAFEILKWGFLAYFVGLYSVYLALNLVALRMILHTTPLRDAESLHDHSAGLEPGISVLVPGYNEEANIGASVRSMLQMDYPDFEIVVINDGSKDGTLDVLKREFDLVPLAHAFDTPLPVKRIRGIYVSPRHPQLRVVDKDNGGKADALNAGINVASNSLFCGVDADSILQRDSLRRIVRPFLEDRNIIACGGTVRVANGCRISGGYLEKIEVPSHWLARIQVVEYLRAFLFGRLGWTPFNAVMIISGAFGLFRRSAVIEAGGYRTATIGEDMELVVRMHRLTRKGHHPYRVVFLPDPLCWTEAPEDLAVLKSQRVRWQRGLLESLAANKQLLFARGSGVLGWVAFPVMLVFEAIGPVLELGGYIFMFGAFAAGFISLQGLLIFLSVALGLGLMLSASALLLEELSFRMYPRLSQLRQLVGATLLENFGYRQLNLWWRVLGIWKWMRGGHGVWGDMKRKGVGT